MKGAHHGVCDGTRQIVHSPYYKRGWWGPQISRIHGSNFWKTFPLLKVTLSMEEMELEWKCQSWSDVQLILQPKTFSLPNEYFRKLLWKATVHFEFVEAAFETRFSLSWFLYRSNIVVSSTSPYNVTQKKILNGKLSAPLWGYRFSPHNQNGNR